jgi:phospholipid/cholesterol/gamma-HCH transport system substrate-binding protein
MERHANYALVGVLTTLLVIGGLVLALWLGNVKVDGEDHYRVIFPGPVHGVSKGAEVQFNGIKVGEVSSVRLLPQDTSKILVDLDVDKETPVRIDSTASTAMQGISGASAIAISAGDAKKPLLRDVSRDQPPYIRAKPSALASLLQDGGEVVSNANEVLDRLNRVVSDGNIANLSAIMNDLRQVSDELAANRTMFADAASAVAKLDTTMTNANATIGHVDELVQGDGRRAVRNTADAAAELKLTVAEARRVVAGLKTTNTAVGGTILPQLAETLQSLQDVSQSADTLLRSVRQDPRGTLLKGRARERELKP